jgi:hypothetical protein
VDGRSTAKQRLSKHVTTHPTLEVKVCTARYWATLSTIMNSLRSAPRLLLCNDSVNTFQHYERSSLCGSARRLYNATLVIFGVVPCVEARSNTSTVTLRVVGGDERGSLKSETVK